MIIFLILLRAISLPVLPNCFSVRTMWRLQAIWQAQFRQRSKGRDVTAECAVSTLKLWAETTTLKSTCRQILALNFPSRSEFVRAVIGLLDRFLFQRKPNIS